VFANGDDILSIDTDTIACMAGALAGALCGTAWLPQRWIDNLENDAFGRDHIISVGERLAKLNLCDVSLVDDGGGEVVDGDDSGGTGGNTTTAARQSDVATTDDAASRHGDSNACFGSAAGAEHAER